MGCEPPTAEQKSQSPKGTLPTDRVFEWELIQHVFIKAVS